MDDRARGFTLSGLIVSIGIIGIIGIIAVLTGPIAPASANPYAQVQDGGPRVESSLASWIEHQRAAAEDGIQLEYIHASWRVEEAFVPSAADLHALRSRVAGRPDHPEREQLNAYKRRLVQGPDVERYDIWLGPRGSFRQNFLDTGGLFHDTAVRPGGSWSHLQQSHHLNLVDTSDGAPPGYNYKPREYQLRGTLAGFACGAFSIRVPGVPFELQSLTTRGSHWRAVFEAAEPRMSIAYEGSWDEAAQRGTADLAIILASDPSPDEVGRRWAFTDWVENDIFGPTMCRVQTAYAPTGEIESVQTLEVIERITRGNFATLVAPPDAGSQSDSVRGAVEISTVHKVSGGSEPSIVTVFDSTGQRLATIPERDFDRNLQKRLLRNAVLLGVPGIVVLILGGALWRRAHRSAS